MSRSAGQPANREIPVFSKSLGKFCSLFACYSPSRSRCQRENKDFFEIIRQISPVGAEMRMANAVLLEGVHIRQRAAGKE